MQDNISLGGNIWNEPETDDKLCDHIAEDCGVPLSIARILCLRGISAEEADVFLHPKIQKLMPEPTVLKDMQKAAERIATAVEKHEQIAIIGDYDVDGVTATTVMEKSSKR